MELIIFSCYTKETLRPFQNICGDRKSHICNLREYLVGINNWYFDCHMRSTDFENCHYVLGGSIDIGPL